MVGSTITCVIVIWNDVLSCVQHSYLSVRDFYVLIFHNYYYTGGAVLISNHDWCAIYFRSFPRPPAPGTLFQYVFIFRADDFQALQPGLSNEFCVWVQCTKCRRESVELHWTINRNDKSEEIINQMQMHLVERLHVQAFGQYEIFASRRSKS